MPDARPINVLNAPCRSQPLPYVRSNDQHCCTPLTSYCTCVARPARPSSTLWTFVCKNFCSSCIMCSRCSMHYLRLHAFHRGGARTSGSSECETRLQQVSSVRHTRASSRQNEARLFPACQQCWRPVAAECGRRRHARGVQVQSWPGENSCSACASSIIVHKVV